MSDHNITHGNSTFICKCFYAQTLLINLRVATKNTSKTYIMLNKISELDIINKTSKHIFNFTKASLDQDNKCLQAIY